MFLESLGADDSVFRAFEPYSSRGLTLARVAVSQNDHYHLLAERGELDAEPSGALWYGSPDRAAMPVVGDWVAAREIGPGQAIVDAVLPRKTLFSRRAAGRRNDEQPVAANIDVVFLVCGLDGDFNLRRLERYLALAAESGADPVVVLNKADLCGDIEAVIAETAEVARSAPVIAATTLRPDGLDSIRSFFRYGRTAALLGSSGVGKSAIVNGILFGERQRTGAVRESDSRGRHTTTFRELIALEGGGALIDTPGMRELRLWAGQESVEHAFPEIVELAAGCRFRDCTHTGEIGCAVAGAVSEDRWRSYQKLMAEAAHHELTKQEAAVKRKQRDKAIHKHMRMFYRLRGRTR